MTDQESGDAAEAGLWCARCHRPLRLPTKKPAPPDPRGRVWAAIRNWPEGPICSGCFAKACETYGVCDGCGIDRLLPGIGTSGQRWCSDCAGGIGDFTCSRCGQEGWLHYHRVCGRCVLAERLSHALDDGTGRIRRELLPLHQLMGMTRPRSGILWLSKPHVPPILRALAHHQVPLTHEGIATLSPWRSVIHVRDLSWRPGFSVIMVGRQRRWRRCSWRSRPPWRPGTPSMNPAAWPSNAPPGMPKPSKPSADLTLSKP